MVLENVICELESVNDQIWPIPHQQERERAVKLSSPAEHLSSTCNMAYMMRQYEIRLNGSEARPGR